MGASHVHGYPMHDGLPPRLAMEPKSQVHCQALSFPHDHASNVQSASNFAKLVHARLQTSFPMQELDITPLYPRVSETQATHVAIAPVYYELPAPHATSRAPDLPSMQPPAQQISFPSPRTAHV